ncbi:hypothetical protein EUA93_13030 [Nocardioides oleivorans]|uniref:Metalloenzyme domain-containing protein n=1 Tax=Nocardioides oleivorans TaxID=273676 RepID=A0A4Q2S1U7_9ACTN|nr:alkaline phosphatase family protein [Nocardioides oleivorans]RYB95186.1 hypothetical protein EUA93_13030 [Nocardioides oleivorans]
MQKRSPLAALLASVLVTLTGAQACAVAPAEHDRRAAPAAPRAAESGITSVVAISLDGLNPTALTRLGRGRTPYLHDLMDAGASTLNARTEHELTITLPNHTGMVTGRRIQASTGGHGVTWNDDRRRPATVQAAAGGPVESVFTSVHESGGSTALFASKTKFSLWKRSWPASLDLTRIRLDNTVLTRSVVRDVRREDRALRFVHLSLPDNVGHERGFMSRAYLEAVEEVDGLVGEIVDSVESDPTRAGSTAIIVTSDHGGRGASHSDARSIENYRIAFVVAGPGVDAGADLYDLNDDYKNPGNRRTTYDQRRQPVRNGDVANLALDLLGLPAVPGSEHNFLQDLDVSATE